MRRGMQITVVLWILAALAYPVTISLVFLLPITGFAAIALFMHAVFLTIGVGFWTSMYFVFRIARWTSTRDKVEVRCECGHVNLVPTVDLFHAYENVTCEKCGARVKP